MYQQNVLISGEGADQLRARLKVLKWRQTTLITCIHHEKICTSTNVTSVNILLQIDKHILDIHANNDRHILNIKRNLNNFYLNSKSSLSSFLLHFYSCKDKTKQNKTKENKIERGEIGLVLLSGFGIVVLW
jgi:hypothetical protein